MPELSAILQQIATTAAGFSWIDWVATLSAIFYVLLAARGNQWCWFWAIVSGLLWAYASYVFYQLYFDALLQLFYVVMAVVGYVQWQYGGRNNAPLPITRMTTPQHLAAILAGSLLSVVFGVLAARYTSAAATYWDAFTTVFSVVTTFLLIRRKLENWVYWIVIDAVYAGLYASRGAYLFMVLMMLYVVIAVGAYIRWRREIRQLDFV